MKILVAEDEPELLRFYKVLIEDMGHEVITARDGQEALEAFGSSTSGFDWLILDYRMPKKNGMEVAKEVTAIVPLQKILLITAYAGVLDFKERPENMTVIAKPFDVTELKKIIR